jgi:hypothetical protein
MPSTAELDSILFRHLTNRAEPALTHPTNSSFDGDDWKKVVSAVGEEKLVERDFTLIRIAELSGPWTAKTGGRCRQNSFGHALNDGSAARASCPTASMATSKDGARSHRTHPIRLPHIFTLHTLSTILPMILLEVFANGPSGVRKLPRKVSDGAHIDSYRGPSCEAGFQLIDARCGVSNFPDNS